MTVIHVKEGETLHVLMDLDDGSGDYVSMPIPYHVLVLMAVAGADHTAFRMCDRAAITASGDTLAEGYRKAMQQKPPTVN